MSKIIYKEMKKFNKDEIYNLYNDAKWSNYLNDLDLLIRAFEESLYVYAAYLDDKGLIRVVGDGLTIVYIQDLLVLKKYQRQKIASHLLDHTLDKYQDVRQITLMSDDDENLRKFYRKNNFKEVNNLNVISYLYQR